MDRLAVQSLGHENGRACLATVQYRELVKAQLPQKRCFGNYRCNATSEELATFGKGGLLGHFWMEINSLP